MVELIKYASNSIFTKKSHKKGFPKSSHIFGSSHFHHGWMSSLYCVLNKPIIYVYIQYHAFQYIKETPLIDHALSLYGNRAGLNFYFYGTQVFMVFACSFPLYAPVATNSIAYIALLCSATEVQLPQTTAKC